MITTPAVSGEPGQTPDRIRHDRIDKAGSVTLRSGGGACTASASRPLSRAGLSGAGGYGTLWSLYRRPGLRWSNWRCCWSNHVIQADSSGRSAR
jgi:hypothetical protein